MSSRSVLYTTSAEYSKSGVLNLNLRSGKFSTCPAGCPKGIQPDDRFSTCAKKIIQGLEILDFWRVTRRLCPCNSNPVTEIIATAPLSNQITGFMKH
eukprot:sb/3478979/